MNRSLLMALAISLAACGDKDQTPSADDTAPGPDDSGAEAACVILDDGEYDARGS